MYITTQFDNNIVTVYVIYKNPVPLICKRRCNKTIYKIYLIRLIYFNKAYLRTIVCNERTWKHYQTDIAWKMSNVSFDYIFVYIYLTAKTNLQDQLFYLKCRCYIWKTLCLEEKLLKKWVMSPLIRIFTFNQLSTSDICSMMGKVWKHCIQKRYFLPQMWV